MKKFLLSLKKTVCEFFYRLAMSYTSRAGLLLTLDAIDGIIAMTPALRGRRYMRIPFTYTYTGASIAAAGQQNGSVVFQNDAHFINLAQAFYFFTANAPTVSGSPYPNVSILQVDSGSGKQLMSAALPVPMLFGNGQFPFVLPQPYLWAAKSTMTIQLINNDGATAYTPNLAFHGIKLYEIGN